MNKNFPLNMIEAFKALNDGEKIEIRESYTLEILDGCIMFYLGGEKQFSIPTKNFYRIVEPDKCWTEKNWPVNDVDSREAFTNASRRVAAKELAHEAIKRIEARQCDLGYCKDIAVGVLKDLIGES